MPDRRVSTLILILLFAISAATPLPARQAPPSPQTAALTDILPLDPAVRTGRLPNGLRYVVRQNGRPEKRAELRLVVDVGSIVEDPDQLGLAHFVEHMAFNGTKNFPRQEMVKFLESIGMRFGPSVNAFTSFDETVYMLQIPTDSADVVRKSLQVLEDWAHNVTFEAAEIDKERGVIIEEWRLRRGAAARMQDQQFPVLLKGSRYAERLPIGSPDLLRTFPHARLRQFYTDWYRPDLMSIVAVGDFDPAAMEDQIRTQFGAIPQPAKRRPRPEMDVPDHPGTLVSIASDKEASGASVTVYANQPVRNPTTVGAYRQQIVESLFTSMLNARFAELAQKPGAPFLAAGAGRGLLVRTKEATLLEATVREDAITRGLEALFEEAARVARFGFTAAELERERLDLLRGLERMLAEKDTRPSSVLAAEYVRHLTQREPIPGIVYEHALYQRFLPEITLGEINALAKDWSPDRNRVVLVTAPQKEGLALPTEKALTDAIAAAASRPLDAYTETATTGALLEAPPARGAIVATRTRPEAGITEWDLSNGVKVVLRPTDFKADEIVFRAVSPGGTSLASEADFVPAMTAGQVVPLGGVGSFSALNLRKLLAGKVAGAQPFIGEYEEGIGGSGTRADLETMFQLVYLAFTSPRADPELFSVMTGQLKAFLANQRATPAFAFAEALNSALSQDHPRSRPPTPEMLDQMSLDKSMAFYRDRFADASDFTFVFAGSFTPEQLQPFVEQYIASLPSTRRKESWRDVGIRKPDGVVERRVEKGIEPKSQTAIVFHGPFEYTQANRIAIRAMESVLETRLREVLREDLGGTYSVSVSASYEKVPVEEYTVGIDFGASPDRAEALAKVVFEQVAKLQAEGPTEQQVSDVREMLLRDFETNMKQNGYLMNQILYRYQFGEDPAGLFSLADLYRKLDRVTVQTAAKQYLNAKRYVKVTLFPEK
jgi:zinc protease